MQDIKYYEKIAEYYEKEIALLIPEIEKNICYKNHTEEEIYNFVVNRRKYKFSFRATQEQKASLFSKTIDIHNAENKRAQRRKYYKQCLKFCYAMLQRCLINMTILKLQEHAEKISKKPYYYKFTKDIVSACCYNKVYCYFEENRRFKISISVPVTLKGNKIYKNDNGYRHDTTYYKTERVFYDVYAEKNGNLYFKPELLTLYNVSAVDVYAEIVDFNREREKIEKELNDVKQRLAEFKKRYPEHVYFNDSYKIELSYNN